MATSDTMGVRAERVTFLTWRQKGDRILVYGGEKDGMHRLIETGEAGGKDISNWLITRQAEINTFTIGPHKSSVQPALITQ